MGRVLLALDPDLGVSATDLAVNWDYDEQAHTLGPLQRETTSGGQFFPGLLELVVLPVAVNLASSVLYDLVKRVVRRARPDTSERSQLQLFETTTAQGDRVLVVRLYQERS